MKILSLRLNNKALVRYSGAVTHPTEAKIRLLMERGGMV